MLVREGGGFILRRDGGGRLRLELNRIPVDFVEKRVRITGVGDHDLVDVESLAPA